VSPRSGQSVLELSPDRDPIALLRSQDATRVASLVPIRYGRMLASPLAFFRGAAIVMAHDLAALPTAGLTVQLAGDAHLQNFGSYASPERNLVFDLNDFDETLSGPFEWDLKRLATSFEIAGRQRKFSATDRANAVKTVVSTYRAAMQSFAGLGDLDVWYSHLDAQAMLDELRGEHDTKLETQLKRSIKHAQANDGQRALATLTQQVDGQVRIVSSPPLLVPMSEIGDDQAGTLMDSVVQVYRRSLAYDRRALLDRFHSVDAARKVVGVGSVGTEDWIILLLGRDEHDPLFLQIKEAQPSVLEALLGPSRFPSHGRRVVEGQRLLQASSDIFLGWARVDAPHVGMRHFYVRQLRDWKGSLEIETILPQGLVRYAEACGWTLARAHARTGDRVALAGYLGVGDVFDRAIASFASAYADLNERDHAALAEAVKDGKVAATTGV
jgi:uncharacterized protein (DUF2252 family)